MYKIKRQLDNPIIEVNGYCYPNIEEETLRKTLPYLTYLSIFSYQVTSSGDLISIPDEKLIRIARSYLVAPMLVITNIDSTGRFSSELAHDILVNQEVQDHLIEESLGIMKEKNYFGIDIDFEYIYPDDRLLYNAFLEKATTIFHDHHFIVTTALAPKTSSMQPGTLYEAHDYSFHGKIVDHVILMTYEWGYTYGPPQAVAPINQVKRVLDYAITEIPSEKILMGIPNYGYDWTLPFQKGTAARSLSHSAALALAKEKNAVILFDEVAQSPHFYYQDELEREHVVWFEDERSIQAKLELVEEYHLGGVSYWTINTFFKENFQVLDSMYYVKKVLP